MELIADSVRLVHVIFGFIGLAAFWIPVFAKKGAVNHVRFGKVFVWSAYVVLAGAAVALFDRMMATGFGQPPGNYAGIVFLAYLTLVTLTIVRHGMSVLRSKRDPAGMRTPLNVGLAATSIAASIGIVTYSLVVRPDSMILLLALSPIGFGTGAGILRYLRNPPPSKREWMYEHLGAMLGGGIAFHTAFFAFGSNQLLDLGLTGWVAVVPWILPAAVGTPAIAIWTRHYRQKFREVGVPA